MDKLKQALLDTIRQLFNMADKSRGCTIQEAENAMAKAKLIMAKYNLSMSDIEVEEMSLGIAKTADTIAVMRPSIKTWERFISQACANLFEVGYYMEKNFNSHKVYLRFYGCETDVVLAVEAYKLLCDLAQRSAKYLNTSSERTQWRLGFAHAIYECASEKSKDLNTEQKIKSNSLMVVKDKILEKMKTDIGLIKKKIIHRRMITSTAYSEGFARGLSEDLSFKKRLI